MKLLYKPPRPILTALAVGFGLLFCLANVPSKTARAQDLYTVEGVHADATAESATKARETAFAQAQVSAFTTLAGRLLPQGEQSRFHAPDATTVGPMIQDFEIVNERISAVRYIGTYTFRFDPASVRAFIGKQGLNVSESPPETAAAAAPTLVLPFYQTPSQILLWSETNPWRGAWMQPVAGPSFIVPLGDLDDVRTFPDDHALTYERASIDTLLSRYGAGQAIIAIAKPLPDSSRPDLAGGLEVYLYRADPGGPTYLQTLSVPSVPGADLYQLAVRQVSGALTAAPGVVLPEAPKESVTFHVRFSGSDEWMSAQRALDSVGGLSDLRLRSLTPRGAVLTASFAGDGTRLLTQAQAQGLSLSATAQTGVYDACLSAYCSRPQVWSSGGPSP